MAFHVEDVEEAAAAIKVGHVRHQGGICLFFHFGNPLENYGRCHMAAAEPVLLLAAQCAITSPFFSITRNPVL